MFPLDKPEYTSEIHRMVHKVSGLLPTEWATELGRFMTGLVINAYNEGYADGLDNRPPTE